MPKEDTQFKKGVSGNPRGRPKKNAHIASILDEISHQEIRDDRTKLYEILDGVFSQALEGKPWAIEFIANRLEGKPRQAVDVTTETKEASPFSEMSVDELRDFKSSLKRSQ